MKLWLDDERPVPDETWTAAYTAKEAMLLASQHDIVEASLDHDGCDGMDFVEWMVKTRRWPQTKPRVHSSNFWGGGRMRQLIERAGPYNDAGIRKHQVAAERLVHADTRLGTHYDCPDTACCRCACLGCMLEWKASGRPTDTDCEIHGRR